MTDETPAPIVHARTASEAIRQINHLTIVGNGGIEMPSDLHQTVEAVALAVERLHQTLEQLGRIARETAVTPGLYDDRGYTGEAAGLTANLAAGLICHPETLDLATRLADNMLGAARQLSHLGVRTDG